MYNASIQLCYLFKTKYCQVVKIKFYTQIVQDKRVVSAAWSSSYSTGLMTNMVLVQNPLVPFCCALGKDTLWHIPLFGGPGKQFQITVISLLNCKWTAISWYLQKQVGVIAYPMY